VPSPQGPEGIRGLSDLGTFPPLACCSPKSHCHFGAETTHFRCIMSEAKMTSIGRDARAINIDVGKTIDHLRRQIATMFEMTQTLHSLVETSGSVDSSGTKKSVAKMILRERRRRNDFFDPDLFGEPAWEMLLVLYVQELDQSRISISRLCDLSGVPTTTALRWIGNLERAGLVVRKNDRLDQRRVWLELSSDGSNAVDRYFDGLVLD